LALAQDAGTPQAFCAIFEEADNATTNLTFGSTTQADANHATTDVTSVHQNGDKDQNKIATVKENGKWRLDLVNSTSS